MSAYTQGRRDGWDAATDALLPYYSAALDEIYRLRRALAYESRVVHVHTDYKTFPKSRRKYADEQIERMRQAARGEADVAYAGTSYLSLRQAMEDVGAAETLTRDQFEREVDGVSGVSADGGEKTDE